MKKTRLSYLSATTLFAATLSFFATFNAYALSSVEYFEDKITFPGAGCEPQSNSDKFLREQGQYFNVGSTTQIIYCPVPQFNNSFSPAISVRFRLMDRSSTGNITCHVKARHPAGSKYVKDGKTQTKTVTTSGTGYKSLAAGEINQKKSGGFTYITCTLPPVSTQGGSGIVQYEVQYQ